MKIERLLLLPVFICIATFAYLAYQGSLVQNDYLGLPTVDCIDDTRPVVQSFTFGLTIYINGQNYPLGQSIGHDFGNCLRSVYTQDSSGTVYIKSNTHAVYTLDNFFQVWHKTFNQNQIFDDLVQNGHSLKVAVNGKEVPTYESTKISPGNRITISFN